MSFFTEHKLETISLPTGKIHINIIEFAASIGEIYNMMEFSHWQPYSSLNLWINLKVSESYAFISKGNLI